jgi:SAM-dependent methyltransferase
MKLEQLAKNIEKGENGIYFSKATSAISYPADGNEKCLQLEKDSFWFKHRNKIIIEAVKKFSPDKTFFDIGGGNGFVAKGLQDANIEVVLIEPGIEGAVNAKKRGIKNVVCATMEDAGFAGTSLDSVGLFDVVEHIEKDDKFLKDIHNYLHSDGHIFITVPAYKILWSSEDEDAGHYRRYTLDQIKKTLLNCGFSIEYDTYIFSILPIPIFFFRTVPCKLNRGVKSEKLGKHKQQHKSNKGIMNSPLEKIWDWEIRKIKNSKRICFGSSCLIVGKKLRKN